MPDHPSSPREAADPASGRSMPPHASAGRLLRRRGLPIVLLLAAALLYVRDIRTARTRSQAADDVRQTVAQPVADVRIGYRVEGREIPLRLPCPPGIATNLLSALARAEPTRFPKGEVDGEEFEVHILYTNQTMTALRAVRLTDQPEALFVGVRTPEPPGDDHEPARWTLSPPARLPDAGPLMDPMLQGFHALADRLPSDAAIRAAISNATEQGTSLPGTLPFPLLDDRTSPDASASE